MLRKTLCFLDIFHKWGPWGDSKWRHTIENALGGSWKCRTCLLCRRRQWRQYKN